MENKVKKAAVLMTVLAVVFTLCIYIVDKQPIGADGSYVGFAALNKTVFDAIGVHMVFYTITDYLGFAAIAVCALFACFGLAQVIKRKSLFKLDKDLFALACVYAVTVVLYVVFEKIALNVRPIIMPGASEAEASFPSSHTMLVCTVMGTSIIEIGKRIENCNLKLALKTLAWIILGLTVVGRLVSGVHWATDIFGGLLYSLALVFWFISFAFRYED